MTDLDTHDPDLAGRLRALAEEVPPAAADLPALEAHAGQRRRRRRAGTALAGAVVVLLAAAGVVAATGGSDDPTTTATEGSSTTVTPTSEATTDSTRTTTVSTPSTPSTTPPPSTDTRAVPPGTSVPAGTDPASYMVSQGDAVVWHLPTGDVSVTPAPGVVLRAKAIGDGTAVAVTRGPDVRMYRVAPGEVLGEVPVPESLSDLWTAGLDADGRPVLVGETFSTPNRLVVVHLDTGEETDLVPPDPEQGYLQPSMTADGRVLVTRSAEPYPTCRATLVDVTTGAEEPTGLEGCGFERAVAPDGETVVDTSEDFTEIVRYDVATGAEIDRRRASQEVAGEGFQIEFDGRRVVLSNAYDDEYHDPYEVLDMETGVITTLPGRGPASTWIDTEG